MIAATWDRGRAYCGQDGCRNRSAFGRFVMYKSTAYLLVGLRWHEDERTGRYRHGNSTDKPQREGQPLTFPVVLVCYVCGVPNKVAAPRSLRR